MLERFILLAQLSIAGSAVGLALKAAGAEGVVVNHCEKPMSLPQIKATIERANELDMLVFACADSVAETLHPDTADAAVSLPRHPAASASRSDP